MQTCCRLVCDLPLSHIEPLSPDPVFLDVPTNSTVFEGDTAVLQCRVQSVSKAHLKVGK